ncbi:MAG TPA: hypothetical protein DFR83_14640, partial [Deltaproteobacteria bacterium]|nr:hypothetical protein [Deltaproteobacteria bacterium]
MPEYNPTAAEQALAAQMESELRTVGLAIRAAPLLERRVLSQTALVLADTVAAACGETDIEAVLLAALVLAAHDRGHSALPVEHLSAFLPPRPRDGTALVPLAPDIWPEPTALDHSPLTTGTPAPLLRRTDSIEDLGDLWMTQRYDREEQWVADAIQALLKPIKEDDEDIFQLDGLSQTFGQELFYEPERPTWTHPARAVLEHLATRRFAILTGGPGTGKTYNIRRVLAAFHASALHQKRSIVIKLAAPTGKAGVRMRESIAKNLDGMRSAIEAAAQRSGAEVDADAVIEELGNHRSTTIHSMIGMRPTDGSARHGVDAPLAADLVIIDEASMVDLPMMRRLLHAIGPRTRLVLLGDRDQLPSVDVGTVLSDIVGPALGEVPSDLPVTALTENRRSSDAPTLALLVKKLQESDDASQALDILAGRTRAPVEPLPDRIRHRAPPEPRSGPAIPGTAGRHHELVQYLLEPWHRDTLTRATGEVVAKSGYLAELAALLKPAAESAPATHKYSRSMAWLEPIAQAAPALMSLFDRYRVLAVHRRGPLGVAGLNQAMEQSIRTFLDDALPKHTQHSLPRRAGKWLGQAILITRNDRSLDVYNGDVGLVLPDPSNGNALALALPKGPDDATPGALRYLSLDRLPEHQTAFAMTVHKSQGSQYDHVAVVLSTE